MSKSLANIIEATAKERGLSAIALAEQCGASDASFYNWKNGKSNARHSTATLILQKINKSNGHAVANAFALNQEGASLESRILNSNLSAEDKCTVLRSLLV